MRFENKGVLITGATGGIGRETCFHFAEEGAAVAVTDLDLDLAESVAAEIRGKGGIACAYELDVTNPEQTDTVINRSAEDMGSLDIIFCNAGTEKREFLFPSSPLLQEMLWEVCVDTSQLLSTRRSHQPSGFDPSEPVILAERSLMCLLAPGSRKPAKRLDS